VCKRGVSLFVLDVSLLSTLVFEAGGNSPKDTGSDKPPYNPQKNNFLQAGAKSRKTRAAGVWVRHGNSKGNGKGKYVKIYL